MLDSHSKLYLNFSFNGCSYFLQTIHKELEDAISKFHGTEDTILYISCFDANAGMINDDVYNTVFL